jgi:hypothetical protein
LPVAYPFDMANISSVKGGSMKAVILNAVLVIAAFAIVYAIWLVSPDLFSMDRVARILWRHL